MNSDAFGLAEFHKLRLVVVEVQLELVDGGNDGGVREDLSELHLGGIGDADSLDFAYKSQ